MSAGPIDGGPGTPGHSGVPMTGRYLRVGADTRLPDGARLLWSMAEGRRGRRWRATLTREDVLRSVILLEVTPAGRPSRLEISTPDGLLTLHPEPDERSIHGNVVRAGGVSPLAFEWGPDHELDLAGSPLGMAVAARRRAFGLGVGEGVTCPVLVVERDLTVHPGECSLLRIDATHWRVAGPDADVEELTVDADGLLDAEARWDLEPELWEDGGQPPSGAVSNLQSRG